MKITYYFRQLIVKYLSKIRVAGPIPSAKATVPADDLNTRYKAWSQKKRPQNKIKRLTIKNVVRILIPIVTVANFATVASENTPLQQTPPPSQTEKSGNWHFLQPYSALYRVISDGDVIGESQRELSLSNNIWQLSSSAEVSLYFLDVKSSEFSKFALINQQLNTLEFDSKTKLPFKKERHMHQVFNWQSGDEVGKKNAKRWQLNHQDYVFDRVSHMVQLRADLLANKTRFSYNVSYKGKLHEYHYHTEGQETVSTQNGEYRTIKLTRTKPNGDTFSLWLAPKLDYFPVQIAQYEDDKPEIVMQLTSLTLSNQAPSQSTEPAVIEEQLKG